jgi:AraC family transcriptional regulator, arabinose operon regulatory protein
MNVIMPITKPQWQWNQHLLNLYDLAVRLETPLIAYRRLLTGHFRQGSGYKTWRSQGTRDWLLIYTVGGAGRFGFRDGEFVSRGGDVVLIAPGALHDYGVVSTRWELLWAHFQPRSHWLEWLRLPEIAPGLQQLLIPAKERRGFVRQLRQAHALATGGSARRLDHAMHALEAALLRLDALNPDVKEVRDERVLNALQFMRSQMATHITLTALAREAELSVSRFAHVFRAETGSTPMGFLEQVRLERARALLELSSRSVGEIALEVGFEDAFHFSKRFRRGTGMSPRAYRSSLGS